MSQKDLLSVSVKDIVAFTTEADEREDLIYLRSCDQDSNARPPAARFYIGEVLHVESRAKSEADNGEALRVELMFRAEEKTRMEDEGSEDHTSQASTEREGRWLTLEKVEVGDPSSSHPTGTGGGAPPPEDDNVLSMEDIEMITTRRQALETDMINSRNRVDDIQDIIRQRKNDRQAAQVALEREVERSAKGLMVAYSVVSAIKEEDWHALREHSTQVLDTDPGSAGARHRPASAEVNMNARNNVRELFHAIGVVLGKDCKGENNEGTVPPPPAGRATKPPPRGGRAGVEVDPESSRSASLPLSVRVIQAESLPMWLTTFDATVLLQPGEKDRLRIPLTCIEALEAIHFEDSTSPICAALFRWLKAVVVAVQAQQHLEAMMQKCSAGTPFRFIPGSESGGEDQDDEEGDDATLKAEQTEHEEYLELAAAELKEIDELLADVVKGAQKQQRSVISSQPPMKDNHTGVVVPTIGISPSRVFFVFPSASQIEEEAEDMSNGPTFSADPNNDGVSLLSVAMTQRLLRAYDALVVPRLSRALAPPPPAMTASAPSAGQSIVPPLLGTGMPSIPLLNLSEAMTTTPAMNSVRNRFDRIHNTPRLVTPRIGGRGGRTGRLTGRAMHGSSSGNATHLKKEAHSTSTGSEQWEMEKVKLQSTIRQLEEQLNQVMQANPAAAQFELMEKEVQAYKKELARTKEERDKLLSQGRPLGGKGGAAGVTLSSSDAGAFPNSPVNSSGAAAGSSSGVTLQQDYARAVDMIHHLKDELSSNRSVILELEVQLSGAMQTIRDLEAESKQQPPPSPEDDLSPSRSGADVVDGSVLSPVGSMSNSAIQPNPQNEIQRLRQQLHEEKTLRSSAEGKLNRALHAEKEMQEKLQSAKAELSTVWKRLEDTQATLKEAQEENKKLQQASPIPSSAGLGGSGYSIPSGNQPSALLSGASTSPFSPAPPSASVSAAPQQPVEKMTVLELRHAVRQLRQQLETTESVKLRLDMELKASRLTLAEERKRFRSLRQVRRQVLEKLNDSVQSALAQQVDEVNVAAVFMDRTGEEIMATMNRFQRK